MNIDIICVGKLKEKYWTDAVAEYSKRLSRFCRLNIIELAESRLPDGASPAQEEAVIQAESKAIEARMNKGQGSFVIALDVRGKELSSEQLAEKMAALGVEGKSRLVFLIGGSLGMSRELMDKADMRLSFSPMTFPHQMMRVILLEQIYRGFKINNHESYHK